MPLAGKSDCNGVKKATLAAYNGRFLFVRETLHPQ
jgi:hypothetical protein